MRVANLKLILFQLEASGVVVVMRWRKQKDQPEVRCDQVNSEHVAFHLLCTFNALYSSLSVLNSRPV